MAGRYPRFDRTQLHLRPLAERENLLGLDSLLPLRRDAPSEVSEEFLRIGREVVAARRRGAPVLLMMGAHLLRAGVARFLIDLMERGYISHLAMNGAGPIHDFEMAWIGATTESVARYIKEGQFGLWTETGRINRIIQDAAQEGLGIGEALGKALEKEFPPHRSISVLAAGWRLGIPVTVHIGIGYDIIHEHPSCDGAALGAASYEDFLIFTHTVSRLEGGVVLSFGSAVMAPEVFLKALAMSRNVAHAEGRRITDFATAVFDLVDLGQDLAKEAPKSDARYYFRPFKTLLLRTVQDGGRSYFVRGDHRTTFPSLYDAIRVQEDRQ